jgi:hypothetical protein
VRRETRKPRSRSSAWTPWSAVASLAVHKVRFDLAPEPVAPGGPLGPAWHHALPGRIAAAGDAHDPAHDPAHEPDGVLGCVGGDEGGFRPYVFVAH